MAPVLMINPRADAEFGELAQRLEAAGATGPEDLQAALRRTYPKTVVRRRVLVGNLVETWYVYRDGAWLPTGDAP